jgi:hypothetical protein
MDIYNGWNDFYNLRFFRSNKTKQVKKGEKQ